MTEDPDWKLIRDIAEGDFQALEKLYARHGPDIMAYLVARLGDIQLAEEVLQDVMLAAWRNASRFRFQSRVRTWLFSIARNRAINAFHRKMPLPSESLDSAQPSHDPAIETHMEQKEQNAILREAIRSLPDHQKETLELVFFHHMSIQETAEVLDISPGTVKSRLHRAKNNLRLHIEFEEDQNA